MTEENDLVNEENVRRVLKILQEEDKTKEIPKNIISSAVNADRELATHYHENFAVIFRGENKVYPVKRTRNGEYSFYDLEPDCLSHREILLRKHFPQIYAEKSLSKAQRQELIERKLRFSFGTFVPQQPFILNDGRINRYVPPYWYQVYKGLIPEPKEREVQKGQLTELQDRFFTHLFPLERDRHIVWKFGKETMFGRLNKALLLMGASGSGKSALIAMFMGLHYPNCNNTYNVKQFFSKQFAWGALSETTLTGVNEGIIEKDYLPAFKIFMSNDTFDAERKFIQNSGVRNYNNLMIATDLSECLYSADQATLNRLIIPQITHDSIIGAESYTMAGKKCSPFTEEEIKRIYNMATFVNKEQAEKDTLALAEFLQTFEDKSINLNSKELSGFQDKAVAGENFYNGLAKWKQRVILEVIFWYIKIKKNKKPENGKYKVEARVMNAIRQKAMRLPNIKDDLRLDNNKTNISMTALFELGRIDRSIFDAKEPSSKGKITFYYEICSNFVDNFLTSITDTPDKQET